MDYFHSGAKVIVMPANSSQAHTLEWVFQGKLGLIMCPSGRRNPRNLTWAMDNEMYSAWAKSEFSEHPEEILQHWDGLAFLDFLVWAKDQLPRPRWVVVPDMPGNAKETLKRWDEWAPKMKETGFRLAMAVQDGMTPRDVPEGVVCFVGGSSEWKWQNVERFCKECERVHVGRVNRYRYLWRCHEAGAESVDGSGFFKGDQVQRRALLQYLKESTGFTERKSQGLLI